MRLNGVWIDIKCKMKNCIRFKKGCFYKSLKQLVKIDPCFEDVDEICFHEDGVYKCYKDDTLRNDNGFDETIPSKYKNNFVLIKNLHNS